MLSSYTCILSCNIVIGINHNAIVRTMETTLMQPGLNQRMVLVCLTKYIDLFLSSPGQ